MAAALVASVVVVCVTVGILAAAFYDAIDARIRGEQREDEEVGR